MSNTCQCLTGFTGTTCETSICTSACVNGQCSTSQICTCDSGWDGTSCDEGMFKVTVINHCLLLFHSYMYQYLCEWQLYTTKQLHVSYRIIFRVRAISKRGVTVYLCYEGVSQVSVVQLAQYVRTIFIIVYI